MLKCFCKTSAEKLQSIYSLIFYDVECLYKFVEIIKIISCYLSATSRYTRIMCRLGSLVGGSYVIK